MYGWQCAVWIDHYKARFVFVKLNGTVAIEVAASSARDCGNIHRKVGAIGSGKSGLDHDFLKKIENQLHQCGESVVVGPDTAKLELIRHIHRHVPALDEKLIGVETLGEITDAQLVDFTRSYFHKSDRMHSSNDDVLAGHAAHHPMSA